MKLLIVGSRSVVDKKLIFGYIDQFVQKFNVTMIISGGAIGVDRTAKQYAVARNIPIKEFLADWTIGKHAGYVRNAEMFKECDVCIAFWDGISKGTIHNRELAIKSGKFLYLFNLLTNVLTLYKNGKVITINTDQ